VSVLPAPADRRNRPQEESRLPADRVSWALRWAPWRLPRAGFRGGPAGKQNRPARHHRMGSVGPGSVRIEWSGGLMRGRGRRQGMQIPGSAGTAPTAGLLGPWRRRESKTPTGIRAGVDFELRSAPGSDSGRDHGDDPDDRLGCPGIDRAEGTSRSLSPLSERPIGAVLASGRAVKRGDSFSGAPAAPVCGTPASPTIDREDGAAIRGLLSPWTVGAGAASTARLDGEAVRRGLARAGQDN
jgi:hypothetical protein